MRPGRRAGTTQTLVLAGLFFLSGCTTDEIKDAVYAGGKIAYDTLKEMQDRDRPAH